MKQICQNYQSLLFLFLKVYTFLQMILAFFLKIKFSKESKTMHKRLLKELTKISGVELREFDINFKPHATIAYGNKKQTFDKIWEYLNKLNKPHFNLKFDNLTILKKPRKFWKIHKIFEIR